MIELSIPAAERLAAVIMHAHDGCSSCIRELVAEFNEAGFSCVMEPVENELSDVTSISVKERTSCSDSSASPC